MEARTLSTSSIKQAARSALLGGVNRFARWYSPADRPIDINSPKHRFFQFWGRLYAKTEFRGAVKLLEAMQVANEPLWLREGWRECRGVWHGYRMRLNIADFYQRWAYFLSRYHEVPLQVLMRHALRPGDAFIDGGANNGLVTMVGAWLVGKSGVVHAFEPNVTVHEQLSWHATTNGLTQVTAHRAGLSDVEEELVLQVPGSGNWGAGTFSALPNRYGGAVAEKCVAHTVLGDSLLPSLPDPSRSQVVIKLDVEGFELRALKGFDRMLRERLPMVMMEMNAEMLGMNKVTFQDVFDFMEGRGYKCFGFGEAPSLIRRQALVLRPVLKATDWMPADVAWIHPKSGLWKRLERSMV